MPTYVYQCKECGHRFEIFQSFSAEPLDTCPECLEVALRKVLFPAGVVFKGSGFYVTDSRSSKQPTSGKKDGSGDKKDKKTDGSSNGAASKKEPAKAGAENDG